MKNFEVQHTIRLYDTELIAEIGRTFKLRAELALTDVAAELIIARKDVTTLCKRVLLSKDSLIRYNDQFQSQIVKHVEKLPAEGRLGYDSENMRPLRPVIRQIVDCAMKANKPWYKAFTAFCGEVQKRDCQIREMLIRNHIPETKWYRYLNADTYLEDMYRRLGNQVLNYARVYKKKVSRIEEVTAASEQASDALKSMEKRLADMAILHNIFVGLYVDSDEFEHEHQTHGRNHYCQC